MHLLRTHVGQRAERFILLLRLIALLLLFSWIYQAATLWLARPGTFRTFNDTGFELAILCLSCLSLASHWLWVERIWSEERKIIGNENHSYPSLTLAVCVTPFLICLAILPVYLAHSVPVSPTGGSARVFGIKLLVVCCAAGLAFFVAVMKYEAEAMRLAVDDLTYSAGAAAIVYMVSIAMAAWSIWLSLAGFAIGAALAAIPGKYYRPRSQV